MESPHIPLDAFRLCVLRAEAAYEVGYAGSSLAFDSDPIRPILINVDLATFAMIVYYAMRSKSQYGMPHIIKTVLKDATVYFFVMAMCHSVRHLCKGRDASISEGVCVAHPPRTDHHQTLTRNVSSF